MSGPAIGYLTDDAAVAEYVTAVLETGDSDLLLLALGDIARARGMAQVAKDAGLGRESLYNSLAPGAKPRFDTVMKVAHALGVRVDWGPISKPALQARIAQGVGRMTIAQLRLWNAIEVEPVKWQQHPYGDQGDGFWVVAVIGRTVIWYNDIEEGFNRSTYTAPGVIDEYWCNPDELETAVQYVAISIEAGHDLVRIAARHRTARKAP
jgi:probable addiction module antidote protein